MTAMNSLWFLAGSIAGGFHVWMLWQASQPHSRGMMWHWTRLFLIGGVLGFAAVTGGILPAAAGWAVAYFAVVGFVATRNVS